MNLIGGFPYFAWRPLDPPSFIFNKVDIQVEDDFWPFFYGYFGLDK